MMKEKPSEDTVVKAGDSNPDALADALVFVYNADSGLFNAMTDAAHKIFSPRTYQCNLCALTHGAFTMRRRWQQFLETLDCPVEFIYADELKNAHGIAGVALPAIFTRGRDSSLKLAIDANAVNACATLDELQGLVLNVCRNVSHEARDERL